MDVTETLCLRCSLFPGMLLPDDSEFRAIHPHIAYLVWLYPFFSLLLCQILFLLVYNLNYRLSSFAEIGLRPGRIIPASTRKPLLQSLAGWQPVYWIAPPPKILIFQQTFDSDGSASTVARLPMNTRGATKKARAVRCSRTSKLGDWKPGK